MLESKDWLLNPSECPGFEAFEKGSHSKGLPLMTFSEYILIKFPKRYGFGNITDQVQQVVKRSGVKEGLCYVGTMHITAGVFVNDAEIGLLNDFAKWIENLAPFSKNYLHHNTGEDNADAHLKSFLTNNQVIIPITSGNLDLGTWQQIFYGEYDGLRHKRLIIKILGS